MDLCELFARKIFAVHCAKNDRSERLRERFNLEWESCEFMQKRQVNLQKAIGTKIGLESLKKNAKVVHHQIHTMWELDAAVRSVCCHVLAKFNSFNNLRNQ